MTDDGGWAQCVGSGWILEVLKVKAAGLAVRLDVRCGRQRGFQDCRLLGLNTWKVDQDGKRELV